MTIGVSSNQSIQILSATPYKSTLLIKPNPARRGLLLFNPNDGVLHTSGVLLIALNSDLDAIYCIPLQANEKWQLDFVTPQDKIYVQSNLASALVGYCEFL